MYNFHCFVFPENILAVDDQIEPKSVVWYHTVINYFFGKAKNVNLVIMTAWRPKDQIKCNKELIIKFSEIVKKKNKISGRSSIYCTRQLACAQYGSFSLELHSCI